MQEEKMVEQLARIAGALEELARASRKGKRETFPPTTPLKEKVPSQSVTACAREGNLVCEGFLVPSLHDVQAYAATLGIPADTAEQFWNVYDGLGWRFKGEPIRKWRPLLKAWNNARKRFEARDAKEAERMTRVAHEIADKRTAHIDAKIEERERKRGASPQRGSLSQRKADNWIPPTENERKEFSYDD